MPYIKEEDRSRLTSDYSVASNGLMLPSPRTAGELNYILTILANQYWSRNGQNYQAFNDIIGAFESAKLELYRRKIAPYEDIKINENGDV